MAITYAQIVVILQNRLGGLISKAGLTNAHYEACIAWGVREAGGTTADYDQVTDPEIAAVADPDFLIDLAELCLIKSIIGNLPYVDITTGPVSEKLSQLTKHAFMLKENKEKYMLSVYGFGASSISAKIMTYKFQEPYEAS